MDDDTIAFFPAGVGADGVHDSGAVAGGDEVWFSEDGVLAVVVADEDVAVVEGDGVDADEDLGGAGGGDGGGVGGLGRACRGR